MQNGNQRSPFPPTPVLFVNENHFEQSLVLVSLLIIIINIMFYLFQNVFIFGCGGSSLLWWCRGFSLRCSPCCGAPAQQLWFTGLSCSGAYGSSWTRIFLCPLLDRRIFIHWTTKEVLSPALNFKKFQTYREVARIHPDFSIVNSFFSLYMYTYSFC